MVEESPLNKKKASSWAILFAFSVTCATSVSSQMASSLVELPVQNESTTITVGGNLYETYRMLRAPGVFVEQEMRVTLRDGTVISVPAGTIMYLWRDDSRPKACVAVPLPELMNNPCAIDMDNDGTFDRLARHEVAGARDLPNPVPYARGHTFAATVSSKGFRQTLIYQGIAQGVLRVSYREFNDDFARAAFTEEYTIALDESFPQEIAIRNQRFRIISVTPTGLIFERL
jgi:hypothetical protein